MDSSLLCLSQQEEWRFYELCFIHSVNTQASVQINCPLNSVCRRLEHFDWPAFDSAITSSILLVAKELSILFLFSFSLSPSISQIYYCLSYVIPDCVLYGCCPLVWFWLFSDSHAQSGGTALPEHTHTHTTNLYYPKSGHTK